MLKYDMYIGYKSLIIVSRSGNSIMYVIILDNTISKSYRLKSVHKRFPTLYYTGISVCNTKPMELSRSAIHELTASIPNVNACVKYHSYVSNT